MRFPRRPRYPLLHSPWPPADPFTPGPVRWRDLLGLPPSPPPPLASQDPYRHDPWRPHGFVLLDLRSLDSFRSGHVPGACHLPEDELELRRHELPPRWRPLLLTSDRPQRCDAIATHLRRLGRMQVHAVADPPESWPGDLESGPPRVPTWEPRPVLHQPALLPAGPGGWALDLACGSGRNAVHLARLGWRVLAVDILPEALEMTRDLAARWGVAVETRRMDLAREHPLRPGAFHLIAALRFLQRPLFPEIARALAPGGLLVYDTFTVEQAERGRPRRPEHLLERGELLRSFGHLQIVAHAEGRDTAGDAVEVLVARRPADPGGKTGDGEGEAASGTGASGMNAHSGRPYEGSSPPLIPIELAPASRGLITLGVLQMADVNPDAPQDPIHEEIRKLSAEYGSAYREPTAAHVLLRPARDLYRALGIDPTRRRPSSEALFRRIVQGKGLYRVNALVDAANLCSLRMMLPVGLYDSGAIQGSVQLRVGEPGEAYEGIGKGEISVAGRWTLADARGPFGNPSSDSWRTRITEATRNILFVIFAPYGYAAGALTERLEESGRTLQRFCGGTIRRLEALR